MAKIRLKNPGKLIAHFIRSIATTLDVEMVSTGDVDHHEGHPLIWVFWHNRMLLMPWMHQRLYPGMGGAILCSPSGDGQIIADVCGRFGMTPVRGSSSRRGAQALVELANQTKLGKDIGITPDGPRGPAYRMHPGVIKLAQLSGAPMLPMHVTYSSAVRLPTWDEFLVPLPFSKVRLEIGRRITVPRRMTEAECEAQRLHLESIMRAGAGLADR